MSMTELVAIWGSALFVGLLFAGALLIALIFWERLFSNTRYDPADLGFHGMFGGLFILGSASLLDRFPRLVLPVLEMWSATRIAFWLYVVGYLAIGAFAIMWFTVPLTSSNKSLGRRFLKVVRGRVEWRKK